jgi:glycine/D-amino acid oxidase-like deaminating enzyme
MCILTMPTKTRYGDSPWILTFPDSRRPNHPRLRGEHDCDVAIMGAGLTGAATAYACAVAGLTTIVLEADRVGSGATGRSAGLLLPEPGPAFRDLVQAHGLRVGRTMFESWRRASLDAAALLRRLSIQCALTPVDSVTSSRDEKLLRRDYDARTAAGIEARWLTAKQVRGSLQLDATASVRSSDAFGLDPFRACLGMALAARKRGVTFAERTPVRKVTFGKRGVEVTAEGAVVRAQTAIVTTGSATAEFKPLRRHFTYRERYLVLTEPVPAAIRKQLLPAGVTLRDTQEPEHRLRWTADNRLLVAGADQDETPARTRAAVLVQRTGQLMYELLTMYPAISGLRPEFGWDVQYGDTADGVPYIGAHRNYPNHLFALGGKSHSLTGAFLAARILARAASGSPAKGDEAFGWTR